MITTLNAVFMIRYYITMCINVAYTIVVLLKLYNGIVCTVYWGRQWDSDVFCYCDTTGSKGSLLRRK